MRDRVLFVCSQSLYVMPLSRLPTVLVQLVMQQLNQQSLLRFARCCRLTLAAASSPFAFRALPPPIVCSLQPHLGQHLAKSLLRLCLRIHLQWVSPIDPDKPGPVIRPAASVTEVHARYFASLPAIDVLDALGRRDVDWSNKALRDALSHVRVLRMQQGHYDSVPSLSSMRSLEDVTIACSCSAIALMGSLHLLPRLTALQLGITSHAPMGPTPARALGLCVGLRRLTLVLVHPWLLTHILNDGMQQLEELVMVHPIADTASPEWFDPAGWYACLSAPPKLHSVSLLAVTSLSEHLRLLALALHPGDPIRRLTLQRLDSSEHPDLVPQHLRTLLDRLPQLERVEFELPSIVETPESSLRSQVVLRCRMTNLRQMPAANGRSFFDHESIMLRQLQTIDPRVHVIVPSIMQNTKERDAELRERFPPAKKFGGCSIC